MKTKVTIYTILLIFCIPKIYGQPVTSPTTKEEKRIWSLDEIVGHEYFRGFYKREKNRRNIIWNEEHERWCALNYEAFELALLNSSVQKTTGFSEDIPEKPFFHLYIAWIRPFFFRFLFHPDYTFEITALMNHSELLHFDCSLDLRYGKQSQVEEISCMGTKHRFIFTGVNFQDLISDSCGD